MQNQSIEEARAYHTATKHSYTSVRMRTHSLDWHNKPALYKVYPEVSVTPLPTDFPKPVEDTLPALQAFPPPPVHSHSITLTALAQLLFFSAGLTKKRVSRDGAVYYFRAAACAGALYPIEIYLVVEGIDELPAGLYHFSPKYFGLCRLRKGDYRAVLHQATAGNPLVSAAPVTLLFTGIYWRSAWKYQSRAYRYCFWDSGTIAAHVLALASALSVSAQLLTGFVDSMVEHLLGIERKKEGCLFLMSLGNSPALPPPVEEVTIAPLPLKVLPLSHTEVEYPLITRMHAASSLVSPAEVRNWIGPPSAPPAAQSLLIPLQPLSPETRSHQPLGEVILKRGSTRHFRQDSIPFAQLSTLLYSTTRGIPADFLTGEGNSLLDIYLICNAVEGLPAGAYYFHSTSKGLQALKEGIFREEAGYLCLEQPLGAAASVVLFFLTDASALFEHYGNRGYRVAQLEAGITGGKLYLAAYALGLGASGLTFYDDEVVNFFSPHAEGKIPLFVVAIGVPAPIRATRIVLLRPDQKIGTF
jgi:SagB-type dehydrogenase family enzyme